MTERRHEVDFLVDHECGVAKQKVNDHEDSENENDTLMLKIYVCSVQVKNVVKVLFGLPLYVGDSGL
jgi:hypothetical protein